MSTMRNPNENTDRPLSDSELDIVCGGLIGETVSNNTPPPSRSETVSNDHLSSCPFSAARVSECVRE
jgi:hypothetical protein